MNETPRTAGSAEAGGALRLGRAPRARESEQGGERSAMLRPDPEAAAKGKRRRFTNEYKRRILAEADRCGPGEIAALLRREGLYSSHISTWRAARDRGELGGATTKKRGPKPKAVDPSAKRITELERENAKLKARAERAEFLVEMQKKMAALLGRPLAEEDPT